MVFGRPKPHGYDAQEDMFPLVSFLFQNGDTVITTEDVTGVPAGTVGVIVWKSQKEKGAMVGFDPPFGSAVIGFNKLRHANGIDIAMNEAAKAELREKS